LSSSGRSGPSWGSRELEFGWITGIAFDLARNTGFVNVGADHDTGAFAVASIRGWLRAEGRRLYPQARTLLITADGGGSNGYRLREWNVTSRPLRTPPGSASACVTFPLGRANGTRWSTGCSR
jgi:hypothetical protein